MSGKTFEDIKRDTYLIDRHGKPIHEGDIVRRAWTWHIGGPTEYAHHKIKAEKNDRGGITRWGITGCSNLIKGKELEVVVCLPEGIALHQRVDEHNTPIHERLMENPSYAAMVKAFNMRAKELMQTSIYFNNAPR